MCIRDSFCRGPRIERGSALSLRVTFAGATIWPRVVLVFFCASCRRCAMNELNCNNEILTVVFSVRQMQWWCGQVPRRLRRRVALRHVHRDIKSRGGRRQMLSTASSGAIDNILTVTNADTSPTPGAKPTITPRFGTTPGRLLLTMTFAAKSRGASRPPFFDCGG